ncbi:uncharacterized protein LOC129241898 [Anastrepha obliqua]|uniref:uncharacterized protein LOC129241898 n=1 Tax=Anastrepha obliqua TaxID=95512 RepID=UPI00240A3C65|nr:uncharacterized protein LOC129241898 [Anastrepha obliqua]
MVRHKYSQTVKPAIDANVFVAAIKEVTIAKKSLRSVGSAYKIDKSKLARYISSLMEANIDPTTTSNEKLVDFVSNLLKRTGGKKIFSVEQEDELVQYLLRASKMYYGLSICEFSKLVYEFAMKCNIEYPVERYQLYCRSQYMPF